MKSFNKNNKERQFAEQCGTYKVRVKNGAGWNSFNSCRLQVSVGQNKHEGRKWDALLNWSLERFDSVTICVNDTLQRFNLMSSLDESEDFARVRAKKLGDEWLERNLNDSSLCVTRWDDWTSKPNFEEIRDRFRQLYDTSQIFRSAIDLEIDIFATRRSIQDADYRLFREFLIEEAAVFFLMIDEQEAADVYPGSTLLPLRLMMDRQIPGITLGNRVQFTRVDFIRNNRR